MVNSNQKGKRGERELAKFLREFGIEARRGQQFKGSPDSPDIETDLDMFHIECKRVETFKIYEAIGQADQDRGENEFPIVMHRRSKKPWITVMYLEDFLRLLQKLDILENAEEEQTDPKG